MAAVMITRDLKESVSRRIKAIALAEVTEQCPKLHEDYHVDAHELWYLATWGANKDLLSTIPKEWLAYENRASLYLLSDPDEEGKPMQSSINFVGTSPFYARPQRDRYTREVPTVTAQWLREHSHLPGAAEALERIREATEAARIQAQYDGIAQQVNQFLSKCRSLNEAVKLMPSLKHYLEPGYLQRLERKVERQTAAEQRAADLLKNFDQEAFNAMAVAAKIQGVK